MRALVLSLVVLLLLPIAAAAKGPPGQPIVEILEDPPPALTAGEPWHVTVNIRDHSGNFQPGPPPGMAATNLSTGERVGFSAHAGPIKGIWRFVLQFNEPGTWRYEVQDGFGNSPAWPPVQVLPAPVAASSGFAWPWAGGGGALLLAAAALLALRLRRGRAAASPPPAPAGSR